MYRIGDVEAVLVCAAAMGYEYKVSTKQMDPDGLHVPVLLVKHNGEFEEYWPITDNDQAMRLAKKFMLKVNFFDNSAEFHMQGGSSLRAKSDDSVNSAIVDCVVECMMFTMTEEVAIPLRKALEQFTIDMVE